jgi:hypothetical protein
MAAHARARPRPVLDGFGAVRRAWRGWRRSRPFRGALIAIAGGTEIMLVSLSPPVRGTRIIVPVGVLIAGGILACALLLLFDPAQRSVFATAAVLLGVSAMTTSHLGGYLVGTILSVGGGAAAFAWVPRVPPGRRVRMPIPGFTLIRGEGGPTPPSASSRPDLAVTRPGPAAHGADRSDPG